MNSDKFTSCLLAVIVLVVIATIGTIVSGTVLSVLWEWFMVPKFGLPPLSTGEAILLVIVVQFITRHATAKAEIKGKDAADILVEAFSSAVINPVLTLIFASLIMSFIQN